MVCRYYRRYNISIDDQTLNKFVSLRLSCQRAKKKNAKIIKEKHTRITRSQLHDNVSFLRDRIYT